MQQTIFWRLIPAAFGLYLLAFLKSWTYVGVDSSSILDLAVIWTEKVLFFLLFLKGFVLLRQSLFLDDLHQRLLLFWCFLRLRLRSFYSRVLLTFPFKIGFIFWCSDHIIFLGPLIFSDDSESLFTWMKFLDQVFLPNLNYHIIIKKTLLETFWRHVNASLAVLDAVDPISFVVTSISPIHFPIPIANIAFVVTLIDISTDPGIDAISPFFIVIVVTLVMICVPDPFLPQAMTISQTINELSFEKTSIVPVILSITRGLSVLILAFIHVAIGKSLDSLTMFQTFLELTFIGISVGKSMNAITLRFSKFPFSFVAISFLPSPHSWSVFESIQPLPIISFSVMPDVSAGSWRFPLKIVPLVVAAIGELLSSHAFFLILEPLTFIQSQSFVN
jgi:hypothetical protein